MIRKLLLIDWSFVRILRLSLGVSFAVHAIQAHDTISGVVSAILLFQAVTNKGCCGTSGCAAPVNNKSDKNLNEVEFEEIKKEK